MESQPPNDQKPSTIEEEYEKEDEEDDEDFNPLALQTLSPEASSSLSSDNEHSPNPKSQPFIPISIPQSRRPAIPPTEDEDEDEAETVMQTKEVSVGQATESAMGTRDDDVTNDAICRRTRARYSLANFTLEELETFLQETDDEDDFHNAGEEEDYRNFLAAVLNDDGGTEGGVNGNACVGGDDDEENDADFEVEIEEALESDDNGGGGERQPETRQKRRQKASARNKKRKSRKLLVQANAPLRPLLPSVSNGQIAPLPLPPLRPLNTFECCPPFIPPDHMMGFTAHQIGQLHCLIHEHVQLLVQVYSLSVLDPSRQQVANDVEKLILEMSCRRDEALARGRTPYLGFCFQPPHVQPSVSDECPQPLATQLDSSSSEGSIWRPVINGPVRSIVNVAPLSLVRRYVADVSMAVQAHKQRRVEAVHSSSHLQKEPLFPLPSISNSVGATNNEVAQEATPVDQAQQPKKSLAAMLVESTKHSVALVPKDIVTLAQRFFPLFNSTLFPHKPPPAAIANRVLFTDAEDELLAMGLMEYNNDWKAIQQRFLPCKSKHQIFVRQKNRSSSKAPENPIKAVRRMKTSPLTAEEKARIHEGLKVLKLDWMSVWKFCVPHRDPSLLPRQWRIALGTQKSYKSSDAAREKRRLYEKKRRNLKKVLARQIVSEKEDDNGDGGDSSADGNMDNEDEAYVHEAFLAGWKPGCSRRLSSELPSLINSSTYLQSVSTLPQVSAHGGEIQAGIMNECGGSASMHKYAVSLESSGEQQNLSHFAHIGNSVSYTAGSSPMTSSLKSKPFRPYRMRKSNAAQLVKLAPDLPPVNLPPSVRVISQSAFKTYNSEIPISRSHGCETENPVMKPHVVKSIATTVVESRQALPRSSTRSNSQQDPRTPQNQTITEDSGVESDLQMHPLLFQGPEDSHLPYLPRNSGSNGFSFFPGNPFHGNLNPFCKSQHAGSTFDCFHPALRSKETPSDLSTIDFHPLLQRSDNLDSDTIIGSSGAHISRVSEPLRGSSAEISNVSNPILTTQQFTDDQCATNVASSPYEMANELDLDIHLSISNSKEKIKGNRARTEHDLSGSTEGALDHGNIEERQRDPSTSFVVNSHMNPVDNIGKIDLQRKTSADMHPVSHEVTLSSKAVSRYGEVNQGEQSLTEIVMEQEELSDSDEEIGEDVEFECEEMADSEGEELDCEQLTNAQNKVGWTVTSEEEIVAHGDHDRLTTCDPQSNICVAMGSTRSPKSGLTQKAKNTVTSSSDLCTPGFSGTKQKRQRRNSGEQDQSSGPCLSSRSTKRKPKKEGTMPQCQQSLQPHLSSTAAESNIGTPAKELRKRVCRMNPKTMDPNTVCSEPLPLPGTEEETESMPL